jgi:hypothetical protein
MKLLIQNRGVAPEEAFTLLGASGSRSENDLIGQFGSGAKLAVTTLLRAGKKVVVYCGKTRMEFKTKTINIDDGISSREEEQVYIQYSGTSTRKQDLGWVLGMGEMDWKVNIDMAIREFVANAIDRTQKQGDNVKDAYTDRDLAVEIVDDKQVRAQSGYTRVFIDSCGKCEEYVESLPTRFLHFSSIDTSKNFLPKVTNNKKAQIYFNGVYVRELSEFEDSLFDYNFNEGQIRIDESRNLEPYMVRSAVAILFRRAPKEVLIEYIKAVSSHTKCFETTLDKFNMTPFSWESKLLAEETGKWQEAWEAVNGDAVACGPEQSAIAEHATRKGHKIKMIADSNLFDIVQHYGVDTVNNVLDSIEREGRVTSPPTFEAIDALNEVWGWVEAANMDSNKTKPNVIGFDEMVSGESECLGFYQMGTDNIYIRNDLQGEVLRETVLEELAHYITQAADGSRDLQSFFIRLFMRWMR